MKHTARQAVTGSAPKIESLIYLRRRAVRERGRTEVRNLRLACRAPLTCAEATANFRERSHVTAPASVKMINVVTSDLTRISSLEK